MTTTATHNSTAAAPRPAAPLRAAPLRSPPLRAALGFLALFLVSAFAPFNGEVTSAKPIAGQFVAVSDVSLEGHWQGDGTALDIRQRAPGRFVIGISANGEAAGLFEAHTSQLRGLKFLNIRLPLAAAGNRPAYVLVRYTISGAGNLSIRTLPAELVEGAVDRGLIQSSAGRQHITSDSVVLRRFLRELGPANAFSGQGGRFSRAPAPDAPGATPDLTLATRDGVLHVAAAGGRR